VTGVWRRLHNEELRYVYCSRNIYSCALIKEGVMGGACSPVWVEEIFIQVQWRHVKDEDHFEDLCVDEGRWY
jgi:hypothetical protein